MMRNIGLCKLQNLLLVLLMFALTGCGSSNLAGTGDNTPGKITAKFDWAADGKSTAKTVAAVPAGVVSVRLKITGPYQIPGDTSAASRYTRVKASFPAADGGGSVAVSPGTGLIVVAEALGAGDAILYEGIITKLPNGAPITVAANATTDLGTISMAAPIYKVADVPCLGCHEDARATDGNSLVAEYKGSRHYTRTVSPLPALGVDSVGCAGCHGPQHNLTTDTDTTQSPASAGRCYACHTAAAIPPNFPHNAGDFAKLANKCGSCHNPHTTAFITPTGVAGDPKCIECHSVGMNAGSAYVQDNSGVRAISAEFSKTSHHVTGRAVTDTDCAVCHLEGKATGNAVVVDAAYHMKDNKTYLRNGNTALVGNQTKSVAGAYPWNPAAPDHTLMDQFCFSCHNAAGAPTAAAALAGVAGYTGTALNPFGDTVSNSYDQVSRVNVVNAYDQFDTANSSHHAVRGQRYTSTSLNAATFTNISTNNYNFLLAGVAAPIKGAKALTGTMYSLSTFTATYTTLDGATLADNITIHCGDCHTVGQFRAADVGVKPFNNAVIGAHGSGNEYMLRNSNGDDTLAKDALVCYICHNVNEYGAAAPVATARGTKAHNNANSSLNHCNSEVYNTAGLSGAARLFPEEGEMDNATFQEEVFDGQYRPTGGGNIFGIKCANCHNASDNKTFGGIHGNAGNASYNSYSGPKVTGAGPSVVVTRKPYRFMPGLGNFRYNGGDSADQWTVKTVSSANKQSCYTLNGASASVGSNPNSSPTYALNSDPAKRSNLAIASDNGILGSWGACTDHAGTSIYGGAHDPGRTLLRPLTY